MRKFAFAALIAISAAACGGSQSTSAPAEPASQPVVEAAPASVRMINASNASGALNIADTVSGAAGPGQFQPRYDVPAGAHDATFGPASGDVSFDEGGNYTVVLIGDRDATDAAQQPRLLVLTDTGDAGDGARVRFVNAAPAGGALTLSNTAGRGYGSSLAYGAATPWFDIDGGTTEFQVATGGEVVSTFTAPITNGFSSTIVIVPEGDGYGAVVANE